MVVSDARRATPLIERWTMGTSPRHTEKRSRGSKAWPGVSLRHAPLGLTPGWPGQDTSGRAPRAGLPSAWWLACPGGNRPLLRSRGMGPAVARAATGYTPPGATAPGLAHGMNPALVAGVRPVGIDEVHPSIRP